MISDTEVVFEDANGSPSIFRRDATLSVFHDRELVRFSQGDSTLELIKADSDENNRVRWAQMVGMATGSSGTQEASTDSETGGLFSRVVATVNELDSTPAISFRWLMWGFAAFVASAAWGVGTALLLQLIVVITIHELGHVAVMTAFKYKNVRILFVPFFGALAVGQARSTSAFKEVLVALSGPVPGLLLAWVGARYLYSQPGAPSDVYKTFLGLLIVVNGINLLPFSPLDGGAVVSRLFLSRRPGPHVLFSILGPLALSIAAAYAGDWWFVGIMAFVATSAFARRAVPYAVSAARDEFAGSKTPFGELSSDQQYRLYDLAVCALQKAGWKSLGTSQAAESKRSVRIIAKCVRDILADARVQSASTRELALGLTLYLAALGLLMPFIVHRFF